MKYLDEETGLLPDLAKLDRQMREGAAEFHFADFRLSDAILEDMQRLEGDDIAFSCSSFIAFKRGGNKTESISSVDFLKAVYAVPFCNGFHNYQELLFTDTVKNIVINTTKQENLEKATEYLRQFAPENLPANIKSPIEGVVRNELLNNGAQEDKLNENVDLFFSFLADQNHRGKTVGRNDAIVSRILSGLNFIAQSSAVVVNIVEQMAADEKLYSDSREVLQEQMPIHDITRNYIGDNKIIFGAPGTGKSFKLTNDIVADGLKSTRVVFHPEYSYYDFVGSYKPVPVYRQNNLNEQNEQNFVTVSGEDAGIPGAPTIDYEFVPGPFTNILVEALSNPEGRYCLIVEEINRADAAAVFGDIFQLLDRRRTGESEYGIEPSKELRDYLSVRKVLKKGAELRIPSNLSIWATMNSADQGVTVLDSAFKRRWNFEYLPVDLSQNHQLDVAMIEYDNGQHSLLELFEAINERLRSLLIPEDRLIGPFFISNESLIEYDEVAKAFTKVLIYLWDDVLRNRRDELFDLTVTPTLASALDRYSSKDVLQLHLSFSRAEGDIVDQKQNGLYVDDKENDGTSMNASGDDSIAFAQDSDGLDGDNTGKE
ncbi:MAG: AAA family ATPase [Bifidobacterium sp.]|nr:AAA family ATPase [Bifidobacterium sp.]